MVCTQIYLTEEQKNALAAMSDRTGRSQSDLIRQAIDRFIDRYREGNRLDLLRQARGIWSERTDLPDLEELRRQWDRDEAGLE